MIVKPYCMGLADSGIMPPNTKEHQILPLHDMAEHRFKSMRRIAGELRVAHTTVMPWQRMGAFVHADRELREWEALPIATPLVSELTGLCHRRCFGRSRQRAGRDRRSKS